MCSPIERIFGYKKAVDLGMEVIETLQSEIRKDQGFKKYTQKEMLCFQIQRRLQKLEPSSIIGMFCQSYSLLDKYFRSIPM